MTNLITENVSFYNDSITTIREPSGEIWAVMNDLLRNIGFSDQKVQDTRRSLLRDEYISRWVKIFTLPTTGGEKETNCINRKAIPMALAKISVTPSMKETQPKIVSKLIRYQEECADVLYKHFYSANDVITPLSREEMAMYMAALQSQTEEIRTMCTGVVSAIHEAFNRYTEESNKHLDVISSSSKKYAEDMEKILFVLSSGKKLAPEKKNTFFDVAEDLVSKICASYKVDRETAYTLVYGRMINIDKLNVYMLKGDILESIEQNDVYRNSFIKCAEDLIKTKTKRRNQEQFFANRDMLVTPNSIKREIETYQKKTNKSTYQYATQCLLNVLSKKLGISRKELSEKAKKYAKASGHNSCAITYYIAHDEDLFSVLKKIVAEA